MAPCCSCIERNAGFIWFSFQANPPGAFFLGRKLVGGIWTANFFLFVAAFKNGVSEGNCVVERASLRKESELHFNQRK